MLTLFIVIASLAVIGLVVQRRELDHRAELYNWLDEHTTLLQRYNSELINGIPEDFRQIAYEALTAAYDDGVRDGTNGFEERPSEATLTGQRNIMALFSMLSRTNQSLSERLAKANAVISDLRTPQDAHAPQSVREAESSRPQIAILPRTLTVS
jgi:hypothetical protein